MHPDLLLAQELVYTPCGMQCTEVTQEAESQEYSACTFKLGSKRVLFRASKITPTKTGQFFTFWKRIGTGPIMPYDELDPFDFLIVHVRTGNLVGQFIFSKVALMQHGIISNNGKCGKLAFRVYAPWDKVESVQAKKSQAWQCLYFAQIQPLVAMASFKKLLQD